MSNSLVLLDISVSRIAKSFIEKLFLPSFPTPLGKLDISTVHLMAVCESPNMLCHL